MGVALVPEVLVTDEIARGELRLASTRSMLTDTPYILTYPPRSEDVAAFRTFRDWLVRQP